MAVSCGLEAILSDIVVTVVAVARAVVATARSLKKKEKENTQG